MKKEEKNTIPAMGECWPDFIWDRFPGGVKVSFVLVSADGRTVALLRPNRWSYELPQQDLGRESTLEQSLVEFNNQLKKKGISYRPGSKSPEVLGCLSGNGVLHVLIQVPYTSFSSPDRIEPVSNNKAYQIETALALSNPVCLYVPALLGWAGALSHEKERLAA